MAIKTQGTEVYVIDPKAWKLNPETAVIKIGCIDGLSTGGNPADQIEWTCLDENSKRFMKGLRTPGEMSGTIAYDPKSVSHQRLYELSVSNDIEEGKYWVCIGLSDGKGIEPLVDSNGHFELPLDTSDKLTRSWVVVDGYVSNLEFDFQANTKVDASLTIQRSSFMGVFRRGQSFELTDEQTSILAGWSNND